MNLYTDTYYKTIFYAVACKLIKHPDHGWYWHGPDGIWYQSNATIWRVG